MTLNDFKARIKDGRLGGCYVFAGEEDYLKRYYLGLLRGAIVTDEALAAFNYAVYEGAEVSFATITDDIMAPAMMSDAKLIEWRYPNFKKMKKEDTEALEKMLDLLAEYDGVAVAFLINDGEIDVGTEQRPGKFAKEYGDRVNILSFGKSSDTQLLAWLKKHFDAEGVECDASSLRALLFRVGHSMTNLDSEVRKLCAYVLANGRTRLTEEDVNTVTSPTPEADTFALSNALADRDKRRAYLALEEMKARRVDPLIIIGMIAKTYSDLSTVCMMLADGMRLPDIQAKTKMNEYRLKSLARAAANFTPIRIGEIMTELCRVDAGAKYGGVTGYTAIELFIGKCC